MAGFMKLTIWQEMAVEHPNGSGEVLPESELEPHEMAGAIRLGQRWWGKYSAPGYMDQTETSGPYEKNTEAALEVFRLHGTVGETALITDDEQECIDMLVSMGMLEVTARRLVTQ